MTITTVERGTLVCFCEAITALKYLSNKRKDLIFMALNLHLNSNDVKSPDFISAINRFSNITLPEQITIIAYNLKQELKG